MYWRSCLRLFGACLGVRPLGLRLGLGGCRFIGGREVQGGEEVRRRGQEGGSVGFVSLLCSPSADLGEFDWS